MTTEGSSFLLLCVARALSDIGLPENVLSFVLCMHVVCILVFYFYLCFLSSGGVFTASPDLVVIMLNMCQHTTLLGFMDLWHNLAWNELSGGVSGEHTGIKLPRSKNSKSSRKKDKTFCYEVILLSGKILFIRVHLECLVPYAWNRPVFSQTDGGETGKAEI